MRKRWGSKFNKIEPIPIASKNNIFIGTIGKRKYIIKEFNIRDWFKENDLDNMKSEISCYKNLKWLIMPKVLGSNIKSKYLITEFIEHRPLRDSKRTVDRILIIFKKYIEKENPKFLQVREYVSYLPSIYSRAKGLVRDNVIDNWKNMRSRFEKNKEKLVNNATHFSHGDFRKGNILPKKDKLIIIDFDQARRDNLLSDLACLYIDLEKKDLKKYLYSKISKLDYFDKEIFELMLIRRCVEILYTFNKDDSLRKSPLFSYCVNLYNKLSSN
jgi:thiamine kinase-like enzyme